MKQHRLGSIMLPVAVAIAAAFISGCSPDASPTTAAGVPEEFQRVVIDAEERETGDRVWTACRGCHFTPDPGFPADQLWLGQLPTTTCFSFTQSLPIAEDDQRTSLARYLVSTGVEPLSMRTPDSARDSSIDAGFVVTDRPGAWVVMRAIDPGTSSPWTRYWWPPGSEPRPIATPPGTYLVRHYGIEARVGDDQWSFTATGVSPDRITVAANQTSTIDLDFTLRCEARATIYPDGLELSLDLRVNDTQGVTLLHNGEKPEPGWRLYRSRELLASGVLGYG